MANVVVHKARIGCVEFRSRDGVVFVSVIVRYYDAFGRDAGYALNGVRQSALSYDAATGRLSTMRIGDASSNWSCGVLAAPEFSWNYLVGSDLKQSLAYPNGLTASWTYGNRGELLEVNNASPTGTISRYAYTYDAAGRRVACAKSGTAFEQSDSVNYGYNARSELTSATAAVDSDYRYGYNFDDIGNRRSSLERRVQSAEYEANSLNQYTAIDDFTPQYDADGNQTLVKTATGIWQITYNGENRPVRWENGDSVITMSFDRMGRRVTKNDQRFVYNGADNNGNTYAWDPFEMVSTRPLVWCRDSDVFRYFYDGNKNVSEIVATSGNIEAHYEYVPFGEILVGDGVCAIANPWRFSGEYADNETDLVYYNFRFYDAHAGRWMSREEESIDTLNTYLFLNNQAGLSADRLGLYDEYVHFYFIYGAMIDLGWSPSDALKIAQWSQGADNGGGAWDAMYHYWWPFDSERNEYREVLHNLNSLTPSQAAAFRACLLCLLRQFKNQSNLELVGILLHVIADTYSHSDPRGYTYDNTAVPFG